MMKDDESGVMITIRLIMIGKEVGSIIGRGGNVIASFREKTGAKISIPSSHGSTERIVTVTGHQSQVKAAFKLITEKLEKDLNSSLLTSVSAKVPVTLKLVVPASQCGSIIGKGGCKIKEIRDSSGCSIQVQSEMLPYSTERVVTLNGSPSAIVRCLDMLCNVMIQFPAKTATVPYQPQASNSSVIFHNGQAYVLPSSFAMPHSDMTKLRRLAAVHSYTEDTPAPLLGNFTNLCEPEKGKQEKACSGMVNLPTKVVDGDTQEITVSNEVIGRIIGKGGSRVNEIRSISGAQISIDKSHEKDSKKDRTITVTGSPEEISLAQYLINISIQLFSHPSKRAKSPSTGDGPSTSAPQPLMSLNTSPSIKPIPLAHLLGGPGLAGPYPLAMGVGPGASFSAAMHSARQMFMNRSSHSTNFRSNRGRQSRRPQSKRRTEIAENRDSESEEKDSVCSGDSTNGKEKRRHKREKFQPY